MEEQNSMYLTQEIIHTNQELRKQLAEDDILIDEYKSKIRILERDLDYCNREIEHLGNSLIYSEEEIESLKRLNSNLSKQLRKALNDVEWKEECLVSRDNQIFLLESKILTLKNRIKEISKKQTMAQVNNPQTTNINEINTTFSAVLDNVNDIKQYILSLGIQSSPHVFNKFNLINDSANRLQEVELHYHLFLKNE